MSFSLSSKGLGALLAVIAALAAGAGTTRADEKGEKIIFSEPKAPVDATNVNTEVSPGLNRLNPSLSGVKQLQEDLFRPLANSMHEPDGLDAGPMPPPRQARRSAPDKHTREMMERRKNWAFADLNDLYPEQTPEEMFGVKKYGADGKEKGTESLIEKYIEGLGKKPEKDGSKNESEDPVAMLGRFVGTNGFDMLKKPFTDPAQMMKYKFGSGEKAESSEATFLSGKGSGKTANSPESEANLASKKRVEDYKRLLDPSLPPSKPVDSLSAVMPNDFRDMLPDQFRPAQENNAAKAPNTVKTNSGFGALLSGAPPRSPISPMLGFVDPTTTALHSHAFDDPTAYRLGMPNPAPLKATPTPPKTAQSIQQMLDPFGAGMPKPKF